MPVCTVLSQHACVYSGLSMCLCVCTVVSPYAGVYSALSTCLCVQWSLNVPVSVYSNSAYKIMTLYAHTSVVHTVVQQYSMLGQ